ncbi:M20/M25/M40 family metallo-hydrolase [Staphylococcus felis]|uniref:M20/M25/M40 family metallo-hydrolase n=2 Tax=Staphylococcus felis TaxID=46127 RepID=A0ABS0QP37_9STAP|nr:M20/M25/M40 family metallo-hydrolase [Staphylococcus felis]MBH9581009.1 M20/M25/M40 family metallo-hydrolase [Staphylococcus felis]MDM8327208.1 M20/M25/M40 family metallo-hydrolase [Staphylococcus felis]REH80750.1 arginine utilization protein RocB [Staphylococcus felis]REH83807.1 arginine utilization protein RocB [Staphylococcus felis]REH92766.1 arginine utilization protein RocB [Staphylococcus felis]
MLTKWQSKLSRETLLKQLVAHSSVTHSSGERQFPYMIQDELMTLNYYKQHPELIHLVPTKDQRHAVVALYRAPHSKQTVTLISHYDTVGIEDYGTLQGHAFDMDEITHSFHQNQTYLDQDSIKDLKSGDYAFGRGSMDMKPGLMLHMSLLEKATIENWDVNLVLITVPDEEVNSQGMLAAVNYLDKLRLQYDLDIKLHLNSEPTFQQASHDHNHYYYTGSIGKIMPSVLVYGRETHVGTPAIGLSSNFILSYIQQEIEYSFDFKETFEDETTPMPVSLLMRDIKLQYDVQTPFRSIALFNLFLFERHADAVFEQFNQAVKSAVQKGMTVYEERIRQEGIALDFDMKVMSYHELYEHAIQHHQFSTVQQIIDDVVAVESEPYRQSIEIVDQLINLCRELGPTTITFFAPPYYPATNASYHPLIESIGETISNTLLTKFKRTSQRIHYFNGISDLSYVSPSPSGSMFKAYEMNTPVFDQTYTIPFEAIERIQAPLINCGPIGKDAHKVSERIHKNSAFEELPVVLETIIKHHFIKDN